MLRKLRPRLTYGNVTATLALFLALGGGAYAAIDLVGRNDIQSKHIKKGQVKGVDVAEETLNNVPRAIYANVDSDGDVTRARGISSSDVAVGSSPDTYCFRNLPFEPRGAQAAIDYSEANLEDSEIHFDVGSVFECPAGTQAFVWGPGGPLGFYIVLYR
jgi:hypothetical protein